jgi:hypothetical protein
MNRREEEKAKPATITTFPDRRYGFLTARKRRADKVESVVFLRFSVVGVARM